MGERRNTGVNVGGSSILVIFILLCLTTFATLSMVSAGADLRLTERAVAASRDYYAADAAAEQTLADIDQAVRDTNRVPDDSFLGRCKDNIAKAAPQADIQEQGGDLLVRYSQTINENQELSVALRISGDGESRCTREMWQVVSTGEWAPQSEGFDLWDGGDENMDLPHGMPVF